jgi:hypothetical protein
MKKQKPDFKEKNSSESWYDLREDWDLVEASLAKQYGIRIRQQTDMPWVEFCTLVGGLMSDTPLGQIISIRAEKDPKTIKSFTPEQRKIYNEWKKRQANKKLEDVKKLDEEMNRLSDMFAVMFGKGVNK